MAKSNKAFNGKLKDDKASKTNGNRKIGKTERSPGRRSGSDVAISGTNNGPESAATRASFNRVLNDNVNDIEWYASHPELLMDAGSISWFRPLGDQLNLFEGALDGNGTPSPTFPTVPGIMTFQTVLTPGPSTTNVSAVNIAARNIYGDLRSVNAGAKNYDPADYMLYILACDSVYAWLAWLRRLYKQINIASMYNKYISRALVQSEGVDFDDLLANISGFRWYINNVQIRLSALAIPGDLPFNRRHMYMFSNLFADSPNQKGQVYKFVPSGYWIYREHEGPGYLEYLHLATNRSLNFELLRRHTEAMLTALLGSEDIGIMSGDTLKYYGADKLFMMEPLLPEEFIVPIYNPEFLDQIHNMSILGHDVTEADESNLKISQVAEAGSPNEGAIVCNPFFRPDATILVPHIWNTDVVFNVENPDPDPAQTMILSRLTMRARLLSGSYNLTVFGTEIIEHSAIWHFQSNGDLTFAKTGGTYYSVVQNELNLLRIITLLTHARAFDRHPQHYYFTMQNDWIRLVDSDIDYSNYTTCSPLVLQKLHESALLSLFRVPVVGTRARSLS